jgi:hypothetical protein
MNLLKLAPLAALAVVVACAEQGSVGPVGDASFDHADPTPGNEQVGHWTLCKVGTDGIFSVTVNTVAQADANRTDGVCSSPAQDVAMTPVGGGVIMVTVTEQVAANTVVDSIVMDSLQIRPPASSGSRTVTGTNTFTKTIDGDEGVVVTFYNTFTPPPPGDEGCTPGFWKNHTGLKSQANEWVTYGQGDSYDATFGVASSFGGTLLEALNRGGGGENALGRHAVAALLNAASSVNAVYTEAQVIAMVQGAYASGDFEGAKDLLAAANELGCPLPANGTI